MDTQQFIIDHLQEIHKNAEAGKFADAIASIKEVKAADAKNIYIIAIEKQIAKLNDPGLQEENRAAIIKSLPPMIDRAISDVQRRAVVPKVDDSQKNQKEAALEKLKSQYFQRADDYVEKKEYQHALEEIRRIYIIEPGSVVAKEYENKIEQLAALQVRSDAQPAPAEVLKESKTVAAIADSGPSASDGTKGSNKTIMMVIAAAAVVIIVVGAWFIFLKGPGNKPDGSLAVQQSAPSQEVTTPAVPPPTTSAPPSGKESAPMKETTQQQAKTQSSAPENKPVTTAQNPVQKPAISQPARSQAQPVQQATPPVTQQPAAAVPVTQQPVQQQTKPAESTPAPMPFVAIETQPELVHREPAVYPEVAIKMGLQGRVTVEVTVDAQGKPIQAKVIKSANEIFNDAAVEAVMKYTFKPAMMSTGPVTAKVAIAIDFRMAR